jgi:hypothetical protein
VTGPEHYRHAEQRLLMAWEEDRAPEDVAHLVAEAQVHATLALAAATAAQATAAGMTRADQKAWTAAAMEAEPSYVVTDSVR